MLGFSSLNVWLITKFYIITFLKRTMCTKNFILKIVEIFVFYWALQYEAVYHNHSFSIFDYFSTFVIAVTNNQFYTSIIQWCTAWYMDLKIVLLLYNKMLLVFTKIFFFNTPVTCFHVSLNYWCAMTKKKILRRISA